MKRSQSLIALCTADDVREGEPVLVQRDGLPDLAIFRIGADHFVTDNRCTHGNANLHEGYQDGDIIECPFHGGAFNIRTGAPTAFPCQKAIRTYPAIVVDGTVSIEQP